MVGAGLQPVIKAFGVPRLLRMWQRIGRQRPLTVIMYHSISV